MRKILKKAYIAKGVVETFSSGCFPIASATVHWKSRMKILGQNRESERAREIGNWVPEGTVGEVTVETEREAEESEVPRDWDLENEKREAWVSEWEEIGVGGGAMSTSDAMTEYWVWEIDKVLRLKRGKLEKLFFVLDL